MTSDYPSICVENQQRYGTDIGRIGPMLLADRYGDQTHFIFELLQNAEDALGRRQDQSQPRTVEFQLTETALTVSHFGKPFDSSDVKAVCGIALSTKDLTAIGRFGIGFKSVYTFTDRPEIHSGQEDFAIENFVFPVETLNKVRKSHETIIFLPFKSDNSNAYTEVSKGIRKLGANALLFLKNIEEITWNAPDESTGVYLRSKPIKLANNVQRITLIGQETGQDDFEQNWLVFNRKVSSDKGSRSGQVEIAFLIKKADDSTDRWLIEQVSESPLVVFFPTVVSTQLGFLVQGPYRTTPSRDNVPSEDAWNQLLVSETAALLIEALRWMRDEAILDTSTLCCLPLDRSKFPESSMFSPLFDAVQSALSTESLLPIFTGGYAAANNTKLGRTQELRELFDSEQIGCLFGSEGNLHWLSGEITPDRLPELRQYVLHELEVTEITPEAILIKLNKDFLESQDDEWIVKLYEFLNGQGSLKRRLDNIPIIRLRNGDHVVPSKNGIPQAFLPGSFDTLFPTMRASVCLVPDVREFLISLGIAEPDPIDDVIWNVLPKYETQEIKLNETEYAEDIEKIRSAFSADSKAKRDKLISELRNTTFIRALDAGTGKAYYARPEQLYLASERLKQLFSGVDGVLIVDDSFKCLRGENVREFLEACGVVRHPRPIVSSKTLNAQERALLRKTSGHEQTSGINDLVEDWRLQGFEDLIKLLPKLEVGDRIKRANLIWDSLGDLEERRGTRVFEGTYTWTHHGTYKVQFPSAFIKLLNSSQWIPDTNDELKQPNSILFDKLGWKSNLLIQSKISFKPPAIEMLAIEAGIDFGLLELLKKMGVTNEEDFKLKYGISDEDDSSDVYDDAKDLYGSLPDNPNNLNDISDEENEIVRPSTNSNNGSTNGSNHGNKSHEGAPNGEGQSGTPSKRTPGTDGGRPFISYVGAHHSDQPDVDGLDQRKRLHLEEIAIQKILIKEPSLIRTPKNNPGFDLQELDSSGNTIRWVEVKAMTGSLHNRAVTLTQTQFDLARQHRASFWLYIVEKVSDSENTRILKIQDPVTQIRSFTFDHGWADIAKDG